MHNDSDFSSFAWYRHMREHAPVTYSEQHQQWMVFRYDDVKRVLSDYEAFSSEVESEGHTLTPMDVSLVALDPPRHRHLRALITQAFTPRIVTQMTARIEQLVNALLEKHASRGEMDIIDDLAYPLTVTIIAEILGVPASDRARFRHWSDLLAGVAPFDGSDFMGEMSAYFSHMLDEHRSEPREDLISSLLAAQVGGEHLSTLELLGFCILLLVAGNVTSTHLLGNVFLCFDEFPHLLDDLARDLMLLPGAIEEVLRYRSPLRFMFRVAKKDTHLGGQSIYAGQWISAYIASANHDEAVFSHPERFDITRMPNPHLSFGHGVHYCLGAPLARLETRIVLEIMLQRFSSIQRHPGSTLESLDPQGFMQGAKHFPIVFTPR
ncbi:putative cytochrome P450 YjiB [Ktedonobacter sp. SOSP1-85]|uniref:cytochrome P450 n=1 Tax=Ktedonobacter sp. SOSP1-85 TaxID=2778367 RepID=UPI0019163C06|nr:cytochrome P450 [Ktedonobacter sp. SOSP1-85]GHO73513.1 putative cytochrome P450 YjiB [Ktedonobacter sp. SOSP1-85]